MKSTVRVSEARERSLRERSAAQRYTQGSELVREDREVDVSSTCAVNRDPAELERAS